ncbi:MAG: cupin fold metalloprotein, WbuC family [Elusimicrobia bacterium]|nr:cupin fold metalloprotein, WbuC family [Elusimicrobiota bacterium]
MSALESLGLALGPQGKSPAYYFRKGPKAVDARLLAALKAEATVVSGGAVRVCFHDGPEEPVHDMVIALRRGPAVAPHKHVTREETYHMIEGLLRLQFFDERGHKTDSCLLGGPGAGKPLLYRVPKNTWHSTDPESEFAVFHERRPGPFDAADTVISDRER